MIETLLRWVTDSVSSPWVAFWAVCIFASVGWYAFLIFYLGIKGGWEIGRMTRTLSERQENRSPQ